MFIIHLIYNLSDKFEAVCVGEIVANFTKNSKSFPEKKKYPVITMYTKDQSRRIQNLF